MASSGNRTCLSLVLAAGEGTRMKSALPKVLHRIAGRSMLGHAISSVYRQGSGDASGDALAVVVGPGRDDAAAEVRRFAGEADIFIQAARRGTAHAVLAAQAAIARGFDDLIVMFADTPLVRAETIARMRAALAAGAAVAVMGFDAVDPTGYGRLIVENGELTAIREQKDATDAERALTLANAGIMALDGRRALEILSAIGSQNAQNEYYLTDAVAVARRLGLKCTVVMASAEEVMGVNDRVQLAAAEAVLQDRLREAAMRAGVTLIAPQTVFFSSDTRIGRDVVVEPNVWFGPGVEIADGATIHAFSHLEGARVETGANVGPYARLRPGAHLGRDAKVGNFVEIKAADVGAGAKISHLSYIGDATVGADANIGAGTITCNYDGFDKARTEIGAGAFIGSNSALVAPVKIGDGAYVGSGSVITENVEPDALALARGRQATKPGWAAAFRAERQGKPKKRP
ncbi:bifunctional UDP-N-acetylglucosamine diphosphorylase/glucosamine-1-phosphate N-acetyltransferase GlmU [Roseiarcaceae bacterium H3SJ34-1]|uniref:bifunctional UDP-N-acetylglucosamine diphosphorylase/glucosamine-1-phosphate N-acetyltransferase GlmU n=1 Tax=Terripilifer ovatus TaxID=3032367 RepID=UPI003AB92626|nr:bifunctional UDP-N-acetylglucosamine diphosphorylase/glucosamine-1-phosphate N-acetyltransferase GlmU [Roseiarcaceae bacterium H3SJ34-1]